MEYVFLSTDFYWLSVIVNFTFWGIEFFDYIGVLKIFFCVVVIENTMAFLGVMYGVC